MLFPLGGFLWWLEVFESDRSATSVFFYSSSDSLPEFGDSLRWACIARQRGLVVAGLEPGKIGSCRGRDRERFVGFRFQVGDKIGVAWIRII